MQSFTLHGAVICVKPYLRYEVWQQKPHLSFLLFLNFKILMINTKMINKCDQSLKQFLYKNPFVGKVSKHYNGFFQELFTNAQNFSIQCKVGKT